MDAFTNAQLMAAALFLPIAAVPIIGLLGRFANLREAATLVTAATLFVIALTLFGRVGEIADAGTMAWPSFTLVQVTDLLALSFSLEPLGAVFLLLASGLWFVNSLYSIGYMRGGKEKNQTRFYMFFAVAIAGAAGVAMAADLFTLFVCYEALTLSTYPLVSHKGDDKARRGARVYLSVLLGASLVLFLPAIILVGHLTAQSGVALNEVLEFAPGGRLPNLEDAPAGAAALYGVALVLFAFGIGKAALMPMHPWLPNAMVAPTPVSALLHAVAVVKAGVFSMLKVSVYIFGLDVMQVLPAAQAMAWVAAGSIVLASLIAMTKDNLKARLAFSTVSQLGYVTLGAMLATPAAILGGALQLVFHAFGKITLFMCAGAIYVGAKRTEISTLGGLARVMPWTFGAFAVGAASIIGLPPMAGAWPKFYLMLGSLDTGSMIFIAALIASSVLNVAYLTPIVARAALLPAERAADPIPGAPFLAVAPAVFTALMTVVLAVFAGVLIDYLQPVLWVEGGE